MRKGDEVVGVVHIGNPVGRIAIWCDEREAMDIANWYGPRDLFYREVVEAVEKAYPKEGPDNVQGG